VDGSTEAVCLGTLSQDGVPWPSISFGEGGVGGPALWSFGEAG